MTSRYDRAAETIASLTVAQALLMALKRKGILSEQEIAAVFAEAAASMADNPLAPIKEAAEIVDSMKQEAIGH